MSEKRVVVSLKHTLRVIRVMALIKVARTRWGKLKKTKIRKDSLIFGKWVFYRELLINDPEVLIDLSSLNNLILF